MRPSDSGEETAFDLFCDQAYILIRSIPPGKVMTYGDVAKQVPHPKGIDPIAYIRIGARWAGYALKNCPDNVPWWRVVNSKGQVSQRMGHGPKVQRVFLEEEGVIFNQESGVSLKRYRWVNE